MPARTYEKFSPRGKMWHIADKYGHTSRVKAVQSLDLVNVFKSPSFNSVVNRLADI